MPQAKHFIYAIPSFVYGWRSKIWNPICILSAIIITLIWTASGLFYLTELSQSEVDLSRQTVNIANSVEQKTTQTIQNLDTFLSFICDHFAKNALDLREIAKSNNAIISNRAYIFVTNAKGDIIGSTSHILPLKRANIANRESFIAQSNSKIDQLFITKPIFGRLSRKWVIQLSRPLRRPDGSFDGIVGIGLPVSTITSLYNTAMLGADGGMALIGRDNIFRAGTGTFASSVGKHYVEPDVVETLPVQPILDGVANGKIQKQFVNGTIRLIASLQSTKFPLTVMVAVTDELASGFISGHYRMYIALSTISSLVVLIAAVVILQAEAGAAKSLAERKEMEIQKKVAEATALDKSLFLAVMSHEIRTPLNGVLGALDLIRGPDLDFRRTRCVNTATECGETLLKLIDDILLLSKSEHGKITLRNEEFLLNEFFFSVHESLYGLVLTSQNRLKLSLCTEASRCVVGDAHRLRQVLANLISNANKFTTRGQIVLHVETLSNSATALNLRISVSDTGIGIPKDQQGLIFDQFRTLDASHTRRTDGTGLGLAICDKLIRAMGSEIKIESEVGRGSRFFFDLAFGYAATANLPSAVAPRDEAVADAGPVLRILLAEDNLTNTFVATEILQDAGHYVEHARNGQLAVALAQEKSFDVILMDISMPEMSGIEATQIIRASSPLNSEVPIVAMTAHAIQGDENIFLDHGMSGYIAKPFRKGDILNSIRQIRKSCPNSRSQNGSSIATSQIRPLLMSAKPVLDVLVLEDDEASASTATKVLRDADHVVVHAANATAAVDLALSQKFDLIIIDTSVPGLNVKAALSLMRGATSGNALTSIIWLVNNSSDLSENNDFPKSELDSCLPKPFCPDFIQKITGMARRRELECSFERMPSLLCIQSPVMNLDLLAKFVEDRPVKQVIKTIDIFVTELEDKTAKLQAIIHSHDSAKLMDLAHSNVGSSGLLGAALLADVSREIERQCRASKGDVWPLAQHLLDAHYATVQEYEKLRSSRDLGEAIKSLELASNPLPPNALVKPCQPHRLEKIAAAHALAPAA